MNQTEKVIELLRAGPVTQLKALTAAGVLRLASRIHELREAGYTIETENAKVKTRAGTAVVAQYILRKEPRPKRGAE